MVQGPAASIVTWLPATEHVPAVWLLKLTARPELAEALTLNGGSPYVLLPSAPKVIVWLALLMVNERSTSGAASNSLLPLCDARIVHGPAARIVTTFPE